jgi:hypothetical protein
MSSELNSHKKMLIESRSRNQFFATFSVNLLTISFGVALGWVAPALLLLSSDETPLASGKLGVDEVVKVGSYLSLGAFFGNWVYAYAADR